VASWWKEKKNEREEQLPSLKFWIVRKVSENLIIVQKFSSKHAKFPA